MNDTHTQRIAAALRALRDLVAAAEGHGWDLAEPAILDAARDALAVLEGRE